MKELIVPPLIINLIMFIVGTVYGINPALISNNIVLSQPGGYVFQIEIAAIIFGLITIVIITAGVLGIRVLGSGVASASVSLIIRAIIYSVTWSLLSIMTFSFLALIPTFGIIIYSVLSIMYGIGVFLSLADADISTGEKPKQVGESDG